MTVCLSRWSAANYTYGGIMIEGKVSVKLTVVACLSMLLFGIAVKADDGHARKEIEAIYAKRDKAMLNKDFAFIKSTEADEYTEKKKDGKVLNREEADAEIDQLAPMIKEIQSFWTKVESVKEGENDEIIVEISDGGKISLVDPEGKPHIIEGSGRSRDTWEHTDKGWKMKYHLNLESITKLDGKPID
jgi:hypothetical protein